jgi:hypothetical protein
MKPPRLPGRDDRIGVVVGDHGGGQISGGVQIVGDAELAPG